MSMVPQGEKKPTGSPMPNTKVSLTVTLSQLEKLKQSRNAQVTVVR